MEVGVTLLRRVGRGRGEGIFGRGGGWERDLNECYDLVLCQLDWRNYLYLEFFMDYDFCSPIFPWSLKE